jgi:hypothetical protein
MHPQTLQCQQIVLRALIRAPHIDRVKKRVLAAAFILRDNEQELSVKYECTSEECAGQFNKCYGVASLHVGRVRDLGLDVVPNQPRHANVVGLPHPGSDFVEAERFARRLLAQPRLIWQK